MTNKELQERLKEFPDDMPVYIDLNFLDEPIECNSVECDPEYPGIFLDY